MSVQNFKDGVAKGIFGMSATEAREKRVCVSCHKPYSSEIIRSEAEEREYVVSALCGPCYDEIMSKA